MTMNMIPETHMVTGNIPRRIIQFQAVRVSDFIVRVYALCSDSTLWFYDNDKRVWSRIHPDIPQDM